MRARKFVSIAVVASCLSLAFALTGCSLLSSDDAPSTTGENTVITPSQADEELRTAQSNLTQRKQEALAARDKAIKAKQDADALEKVGKRNNIDINDPSSRTYKARQIQRDAEASANTADDAVAPAIQAVETAQARIEAIKNGPSPDNS
jgi:hypothetical protein